MEVGANGVTLIPIANPLVNALHHINNFILQGHHRGGRRWHHAAGSIRITMEVGVDGVALITIATRPVNVLHPIIIVGLKDKYTSSHSQIANASLLPSSTCRWISINI